MFDPTSEVLRAITEKAVFCLTDIMINAVPRLELRDDTFDEKTRGGLQKITSESIEKTQLVKTLVNRDVPVPLPQIYVPRRFRSGKRTLAEISFLPELARTAHCVIAGTAGTGKSLFMRTLFRTMLEEQREKIPVFFELRNLQFDRIEHESSRKSGQPANAFVDLVFWELRDAFGLDRQTFDRCLERGLFALLLDGLDEVPLVERKLLSQGLQRFAQQRPGNWIIVSARPESGYDAWSSFRVFHILPFEKFQVLDQLEKAPCDRDMKTRFIERVVAGGFEEHREFLEIPLLAVLMLLMFDEFAQIPSKQHLFYEQAFETLVRRHDRTKGLTRDLISKISADEFRKLFAAMCARSYARHELRFTSQALKTHIEAACRVTGLHADAELLMQDLHESVSLLQQDGPESEFIHRTFQEYFAAQFIVNRSEQEAGSYLRAVEARGPTDRVFRFAFDLEREFLERAWVLPTLQRICERLEAIALTRDLDQFAALNATLQFVDRALRVSADRREYPEHERLLILEALYQAAFPFAKDYAFSDATSRLISAHAVRLDVRMPGFTAWRAQVSGDRRAGTIPTLDVEQLAYPLGWLFESTGANAFVADVVRPLQDLRDRVESERRSRSMGFDDMFAARK